MTTTEAHPADGGPPKRVQAHRRPMWLRWTMEGMLLVGAFFAIGAFQERHLVDEGTVAPSFDLRNLAGGHVSLESLRGKRVLLHFWAPWCGVCRREFGTMSAVNRHLDKDETFLSVVADAPDVESLRRFTAEHEIDYPVLIASDDVVKAFHVSAFPTNYYLDAEGRVRDHTIGMTTRYAVEARLGCAKR